jgi:hypothetical protein
MSDESTVEIPENQQEPETAESESDETKAGLTGPELSARAERYGLTPEQAEMLDLYL